MQESKDLFKDCFENLNARITEKKNVHNRIPPCNFIKCFVKIKQQIHRGSYMSAHVLLILLNALVKRDKMRGLPSILSFFRNEFNKFNNTGARMLDSRYHMR